MKILFFDIETTGLSPELHAIHELSGIITIDGVVQDDFCFHIQPHEGAVIDEEALKVSGINHEMLCLYDKPKDVHEALIGILSQYCNKYDKADKFFLAGYNNAAFDNPFLRKFFELNGDKFFGSWFWSHALDVMVLAADYLKQDRSKMQNFQLRTVAEKCGIEVDGSQLHSALYDVLLTKKIYDVVGRNVTHHHSENEHWWAILKLLFRETTDIKGSLTYSIPEKWCDLSDAKGQVYRITSASTETQVKEIIGRMREVSSVPAQ